MNLHELYDPHPDGAFASPLGLKHVNSMRSNKVEVLDCRGLKIAVSRDANIATLKAMRAMVHGANNLPSVLEALKIARKYLPTHGTYAEENISKVEAAIAKAEKLNDL